jgi:hypothetical protein
MSAHYSHNSHSRGRARVHNTSIGTWARIQSIRCVTDETRRSRLELSISQETMDFISACQTLHQRVVQGCTLTCEEIDLIEFSALDLLNHVKPLD